MELRAMSITPREHASKYVEPVDRSTAQALVQAVRTLTSAINRNKSGLSTAPTPSGPKA
jgi:hypothetical protein